jgi:hypothetical protein
MPWRIRKATVSKWQTVKGRLRSKSLLGGLHPYAHDCYAVHERRTQQVQAFTGFRGYCQGRERHATPVRSLAIG